MIQHIVPTPKNVQLLDGQSTVGLVIECDEAFSEYKKTLKAAFKKLFKITLTDGCGGITLRKIDTLPHQSYRYDTRDGIVLSASDDEGILYAIATLIQTATVKDGSLTVSKALIEDHPDKEFRALMICRRLMN